MGLTCLYFGVESLFMLNKLVILKNVRRCENCVLGEKWEVTIGNRSIYFCWMVPRTHYICVCLNSRSLWSTIEQLSWNIRILTLLSHALLGYMIFCFLTLLICFVEAMAPHSSTFAWEIPWTEEAGRLQSMGSLGSDTTEQFHFHFSLSCIGEKNGNPLQCSCLASQGRGNLVGCRLWGPTELDTTEAT